MQTPTSNSPLGVLGETPLEYLVTWDVLVFIWLPEVAPGPPVLKQQIQLHIPLSHVWLSTCLVFPWAEEGSS
jgi:hypothetical protein